MAYLLDTNVVSELRRPRPNPLVLSFIGGCAPDELWTSVVTLAEIRYGIEKLSDLKARIALELWLRDTVRPLFAERVISINEETMLCWRRLLEFGRKQGRTLPQPDLLLAATALEHGLTLVTRNTRDFDGLGLALHNPWTAEPA